MRNGMVQVDITVSPCNAVVMSVVASVHCYGISCLCFLAVCHSLFLFDATESALSRVYFERCNIWCLWCYGKLCEAFGAML